MNISVPLGYAPRALCRGDGRLRARARALGPAARQEAVGLPSEEDAHFGAVTFVQRSDSALALNPHAHVLALDGVYVRDAAGALVFHALPAPTQADVHDVAARTHGALVKLLAARPSLDAPWANGLSAARPGRDQRAGQRR